MSMKLSVEKLVAGGRLGTIIHHGCPESVILETPACTLYTRAGSAPHLGVDTLKHIPNVPRVATMTLASLAPHHEVLKEFGKGLVEFTSFKDSLVFTTLHDSSSAVPSGKNDRNGVAVWGKGGKLKIDPPLFAKIQEAFRPNWFQAPSDGDTDHNTGKKRLRKAVDNTLDFLDDTLELIEGNKAFQDSKIIGVVEGGFDEAERIRSAKETAARNVDGFLLEGFEKGHSGMDLFGLDNFSSVLSNTLKHLPEDKPRIMETVWSPLQVIQAFKLGVDIFSSSYPYLLTERGEALVASYTLPQQLSPTSKLETMAVAAENKNTVTKSFTISLKDPCHVEDFRPVMPGCPCHCCTTFTRSYIHHLLNTSELLAYVLLTIHNFYQYFDFFHHLREAARQGHLDDLQASLEHQENGKH